MPDFYISFATKTDFLGATVVTASSESAATDEATRLGINPGGEAAILPMPARMTPTDIVEMQSYKNRLVTKAELLANGAKRISDMPQHAQDRFQLEATTICGDCNHAR